MLDRVRIASPCSASWDLMKGDEQVRFCTHCSKHVYNVSAMSRRDAETLLSETEGRVCARFYRRADGTVMTEDCPVGLRAKAVRLKRRVSFAMPGILGLVPAFAQSPQAPAPVQAGPAKGASVQGIVRDQTGAAVPNAGVSLLNERTGLPVVQARSNAKGEYRLTGVEPGTYTFRAEMLGFEWFTLRHFVIGKDIVEKRDARLVVPVTMGEVVSFSGQAAEPVMSKIGDHLK